MAGTSLRSIPTRVCLPIKRGVRAQAVEAPKTTGGDDKIRIGINGT